MVLDGAIENFKRQTLEQTILENLVAPISAAEVSPGFADGGW